MRPRTIILSMILLQKIKKEKKKKRRYWVSPQNARRLTLGEFHRRYDELREDPKEFFNYFRMSENSFKELLALLINANRKRKCRLRRGDEISDEQRLTITLRYLATGSSFQSLSRDFLTGTSTISPLIRNTCQVILDILTPTEMPPPTQETWCRIARDFYKASDFPNCIGVIVGKRISIQASLLVQYRPVLLAIADANYFLTAIDFEKHGPQSYGNSLKRTPLGKKIENWQTFQIPKSQLLPNTTNREYLLNHVFVGDESFCLLPNLLRPFPKKVSLTSAENKIYNFRLQRAVRYGEGALGILAGKWEVLDNMLLVPVEMAELVCRTACVLHNFVLRRDAYVFSHTLSMYDSKMQLYKGKASGYSQKVRMMFRNYCISPIGATDYQHLCLRKTQQ